MDLSRESVPDATTLLKFRRLLNENDLTRALFAEINAHLREQGLLMRVGTIVDATIIAAPSSTKNEKKERDPDMHQAKKGNQWHFGMKAHIGVDADSGLVHTVIGTAANVNDVTQAGALLHGQEQDAFGDAGYRGVQKRQEAQGPTWHVAMQPGKRRQLDARSPWAMMLERIEQLKASVRAKVEHPFHVIKNLFGHRKTRYKGMAKNEAAVQPVRSGQPGNRQEVIVEPPCPRCLLSTQIGPGKGCKQPFRRICATIPGVRPRQSASHDDRLVNNAHSSAIP